MQEQLTQEHQRLLVKDKEFHHQRAKKNWALRGDRNTAYFRQAIIKRTRKNRITYLSNLDGSESTTQEQLLDTFMAYFKEIFTSQLLPHHDCTNISACILTSPSNEDIEPQSAPMMPPDSTGNPDSAGFTNSMPTFQELHAIIKEMRSNASPGPDDLNAAFYKSAWPWAAADVHNLVTSFYTIAFMQPEINQTFIVLVPKKNSTHYHSGL